MKLSSPARFASDLLPVAALALLPLAAAGLRAEPGIRVEVRSDAAGATLSPLLWGTNLLFWIDDDAAVAAGAATQLRNLSTGLLRFPGGTVAQNYDWRTNRLMNPARWPHGPDGAPTTDTDEFIALCRAVGAEPDIVVNTEGWVLKGDLERGAAEAAAWVRYCNVEKRYGVKYWEIGNENYYHVTQNAREYAACVNRYVRAMKAVDPTIQIAVNGPWSTSMYGEGDLCPPPLRTVMLDFERRITSPAETKVYDEAREALKAKPRAGVVPGSDSEAVRKILEEYERRADTPERQATLEQARAALRRDPDAGITWARPWWETVVPLCGANVDIIVQHVYYPRGRIPEVVSEFEKTQALFRRANPGRPYHWFFSEFNSVDKTLSEAGRAVDNLELWLRLAAAGMDMACEWPFRWGGENRFAPLYQRSTGKIRPMGRLLEYVTKRMRGTLTATKSSSTDVPVFCARDGQALTLALFGSRLKQPTAVTFNFEVAPRSVRATAWVPSGTADFDSATIEAAQHGPEVSIVVPAGSFVLLEGQSP